MFLLSDDLASLRRDLDAADSATAVLQARCEAFGLPGGPVVRARVEPSDAVADEAVRGRLKASPGELLACRRVRLVWGDLILSRAVNWYRPERLTADMRRRLAETDEPFGVVARPLGYRRVRRETRLVEAAGRAPFLYCRAILETPDGEPLALVEEVYPGD
jgi:chorismate-pyruvate lyase